MNKPQKQVVKVIVRLHWFEASLAFLTGFYMALDMHNRLERERLQKELQKKVKHNEN